MIRTRSKLPFIQLALICIVSISSCKKDKEEEPVVNNPCGTTESVSDIDGNIYQTISIGNQCWLQENLKTTRFRNGIPIDSGLTPAQWSATNSPAYTFYNDSARYDSLFGKLYNYYAVISNEGLCPTGWRVATITDWTELLNYLDPASAPDTNCLQCSISDKLGLNNLSDADNYASIQPCPGNDSISFKAMAGGGADNNLSYGFAGSAACFWAAQSAQSDTTRAMLEFFCTTINKAFPSKNSGLSVRCVKE